jgi:uncharacterized surface protein with fasciclin (FAS1) repeats
MRAMARSLVLALLLAAPARAEGADIMTMLRSTGFGTFAGWIETAGYDHQLYEKGPFTILAPTDEAIAAQLTDEEIAALVAPEGRARLMAILQYHVWPGRYAVAELPAQHVVHTMGGYAVSIFDLASGLHLNNAAVLGHALEGDNGNVIPIDKVFVQAAP